GYASAPSHMSPIPIGHLSRLTRVRAVMRGHGGSALGEGLYPRPVTVTEAPRPRRSALWAPDRRATTTGLLILVTIAAFEALVGVHCDARGERGRHGAFRHAVGSIRVSAGAVRRSSALLCRPARRRVRADHAGA